MRYYTLILLLVFFASCLQNKENKQNENQHAADLNHGTKLYESGFLKFADTSKLDSLKAGLITSFNIYDEDNNKIAPIDAEELAECSFDFFLPKLNKMLGKRGIKLHVEAANNFEATNDILINGKRIKLYTKQELDNGKFWDVAARNFFKEVNRLLNTEKTGESFYLLYGGNDLHVLLLTTNEFNIIADRYKNNIEEAPYIP